MLAAIGSADGRRWAVERLARFPGRDYAYDVQLASDPRGGAVAVWAVADRTPCGRGCRKAGTRYYASFLG